ncbi:MAG: HDOD domain-containing protein [Armatimonadota bacterium]
MTSANVAPLPPTAAMLLIQSTLQDTRSTLTVLASDLLVSRTVSMVCEMIGFEGPLVTIVQQCGPRSLAQLAIASDLWISGSRVKCKTISSSHMSLGSMVTAILTPSALEQDINTVDSSLQVRACAFGLFSTLAYSLVARQLPQQFEDAAAIAQYRQIPLSDAYRNVVGCSIQEEAGRLAKAWNLSRELTIALQGPRDFDLTREERLIVGATEVATIAAQSAGVGIEPWPYTVKTDKIEQIALIQAMGMRARRVSGQLEGAVARLKAA